MQVQQVKITDNKCKTNNIHPNKQVAFNGAVGDFGIKVMDSIDMGGFAAAFILQDFLGMAGPRSLAGLFRNHDKTGKLNWAFAIKEALRECISGPSAFLIPMGMMFGIKKLSGTANNVPIDFIHGFSNTFSDFATNNAHMMSDVPKAKQELYKQMFKNMLSSSTNGGLAGSELESTAENFASRLVEIEKAPKKSFFKNLRGIKVDGSQQDLKQQLLDDFVNLRKKHLGFDGDKVVAEYGLGEKKIATSFRKILDNMKDFADDSIKTLNKALQKDKDLNINEFTKKFMNKRSGSRFLANVFMWLAVVAFYRVIPKIYNSVTNGRDPGRDGLDNNNNVATDNKVKESQDVKKSNSDKNTDNNVSENVQDKTSFTGLSKPLSSVGKKVVSNNFLKKFSDNWEFDGATMSLPAMLTLLYGFCLPPRFRNAQSSTDKKEIVVRDVISFYSILFLAKTITRACSDAFAKVSGLALNIKPSDHNESFFKKFHHYFWPSGGVQVLDHDRIVANYSNVDSFKNGISDMFKFIDGNGGNVGKMLNINEDIKKAATTILGEAPNKNMKLADIISKFEGAKNTPEYAKIIDILKNPLNPIVHKAKAYNSAFGALSTLLLVPGFMVFLSKYCERMTKKAIAKQNLEMEKQMAHFAHVPASMQAVTNKPTMAGFLNQQK